MKKYYKVYITLLFAALSAQQISAQSWLPMSTGMGGGQYFVHSLFVCDTSFSAPVLIFAGGDFVSAGGSPANHIAYWDPNIDSWYALVSGTNGEVDAIALFNGKIYAGGMFDSAGGLLAHHIASCDAGNSWDSALGGLNGNVYALRVYKNALYVGGSFTMANGIKAHRIAKWDGVKWDSVGAGFDSNTVYALAVYRDTLYAGGSFTKSAGQPVNYIAKWNGTKWLSVFGGTNNTVYALDSCAPQNYYHSHSYANFLPGLYVGGAFTQAGGINANHIAVLDTNSTKWDSLGSGTDDTVRALCRGAGLIGISARIMAPPGAPFVLIGGNFTKTGSMHSPYVGYWNGLRWDTNGTYTSAPVYAVAAYDRVSGYDYCGGIFDSTYDYYNHWQTVNYVAQLEIDFGGGFNELSNNNSIRIYPNPNNGVFQLKITNYELKMNGTVEIYNTLGEKVYSALPVIRNSQFVIDICSQPSGVYLCRVIAHDGSVTGSSKIIIK